MLTKEQNRLVVETNPGTPGGDLMRRYWQPAALSEELGADPLPVRIMGEDLMLFRGKNGAPALVERQCPHRLADLSYGFLDPENGTLRCIYHGWLFDGTGRCREQPGEAKDSTFKDRVRLTAYPCYEANGIILAYLGPGEPPALPALPFLSAPAENVWVTKGLQECNYLQANEGNLDPQHLSFLHRMFAPQDQRDVQELIGADVAPDIEIEEMPFGFRIFAIRNAASGRYVRITNFIMPNCSSFQGGPVVDPAVTRIDDNSAYQMHWHVPIDDETHWKYQVYYRLDGPVDKPYLQRTIGGEDEPYNRRRRASNRYLQDRADMGKRTLAGLGFNFQDHDRYATESQGRILDRSREHLAATDRAVALMRKYLLAAIDDVRNGRDPLMARATADPFAGMVVIGKVVPADIDILAAFPSGGRP